MFRPISISLSPNTEKDDIFLALKLIFLPWKWKPGQAVLDLENQFKKYLGVRHAFAFNSGRSALMAILESLNLPKNSEVLLQAFTCNAASNPIIWSGKRPVYVDCADDFNIDINDLKKKITPQSKAVMVQHTFGTPAGIDNVLEICRQNNLILIEDCAHSLGAEFDNKKVGTMGGVSFFSFGRDKIISSVYGGIAATDDDVLAGKMNKFQEKIKYPSSCWVLQSLLHPVLMNIKILPLYGFLGLGKFCLVLSQWLHILPKAVHWKEKRGEKPAYFPKKMPNALALLALNQLKKLERFNQHRREMAAFYSQSLQGGSFKLSEISGNAKSVFLRFTLQHPDAHQIIKKAWKNNFLIGDWYTSPIAPIDTKLEKVQYKLGSCPNAERLAKTTLNLPTHINISQESAEKIVAFLKEIL